MLDDLRDAITELYPEGTAETFNIMAVFKRKKSL